MTRFVVCGETLIDLVPAVVEPSAGDLPASFSTPWSALSAGGPMNSAVALGTLGADSHFLGRLSTDAFGRQLRSHIEAAGVHLDLAVTSEESTSLAVVSLDAEGVASYTFHFAGTANFGWRPEELPELGSDDWVHIASLATVVEPGDAVLLEWVNGLGCGLSYDINVRPTVISDPLEYWAKVEPWLQAVGRRQGVVKASDEDVRFLAPALGDGDVVEIAARWVKQYGLSLAVVTLGAGGAAAVDAGGETTRIPGFPTKVVDTVGAGDTFMAGFLDGHVRLQQPLSEAMRRGAAAASIVCSRRGAQTPTAAEVAALLA